VSFLKLSRAWDIKDCLTSDFQRLKSHKKTILSKEATVAGKKLRRDGIIVVENFMSKETCDYLLGNVLALEKTYHASTLLDNDTYLNYRGSESNTNDRGMLDVFNIDHAVPELSKFKTNNSIIDLVQFATRKNCEVFSVNAYLNRGIKTTRDFHVDDLKPITFKGFIYLTDVPDNSYGPYTYVKRSQKFSFFRLLNLVLKVVGYRPGFGDMPLYNKRRVLNAIGKRGSLVLSDQTGIHRGLPQEDSKLRVALVINLICFDERSELNEHWQKVLREKIYYPIPVDNLKREKFEKSPLVGLAHEQRS